MLELFSSSQALLGTAAAIATVGAFILSFREYQKRNASPIAVSAYPSVEISASGKSTSWLIIEVRNLGKTPAEITLAGYGSDSISRAIQLYEGGLRAKKTPKYLHGMVIDPGRTIKGVVWEDLSKAELVGVEVEGPEVTPADWLEAVDEYEDPKFRIVFVHTTMGNIRIKLTSEDFEQLPRQTSEEFIEEEW